MTPDEIRQIREICRAEIIRSREPVDPDKIDVERISAPPTERPLIVRLLLQTKEWVFFLVKTTWRGWKILQTPVSILGALHFYATVVSPGSMPSRDEIASSGHNLLIECQQLASNIPNPYSMPPSDLPNEFPFSPPPPPPGPQMPNSIVASTGPTGPTGPVYRA